MNNKNYILKEKNIIEVDLETWAAWMRNSKERFIKKTKLPNELEVSTVFLGLDHNWGKGEPLLFETMVFGLKDVEDMERYSTYDEAEKGHEVMVNKYQS